MMIVAQKQHIDDDRWNQMCRRVRRVELFNLLVVILCAFVSNKVTITWNTTNSTFDPKELTKKHAIEVEAFVRKDPQSKPFIRKVSKEEDTESVQVERNQSESKDSIRISAPFNLSEREEKLTSNNEIEIYLAEQVKMAESNVKSTQRIRNTKTDGKTERSTNTTATLFHVNENHDERKRLTKKVLMSKNNRDLQSQNTTADCDGTLFELEIELDMFSEETAWELAKTTPDNVIFSVNYTMDDSLTTQTFTECLDDGNYIFTLYDAFWDGIDCGASEGFEPCFNITLNNVLVVSDIIFDFGSTSHTFDTATNCPIGSLFEVEDTSGRDFSDISWSLIQKIHNKEDQYVNLVHEARTGDSGETSSFFSACVNTGTFMLEGQEEVCEYCYRVLIDNEEIRQGKDFLGFARHTFYVSPSGKAFEQHCDKLPQLTPTNFVNNFAFDVAIERKLDAIYSLASMDTITNDPFSPQYKAACWMVFDDTVVYKKEQSTTNNTEIISDQFMERFVLAIFLFATEQDIEKLQLETCDYDKSRVRCNEDNSIKSLDFFEIGITGFIPSELHHLLNLEILELGTNNLHGTIPNQLGRLNHLKELYLDSNAITGTIPVELGNLVSLEIISLRFNRLTGTIPVSIGRCRQLKMLFLNNNLLDGPILPGLLKSNKLEFLTLGPNSLTGTIPSQIVNLKALQELVLQRNSLTGTIPSVLWTLSKLSYIDLDKNSLTGTIDSGIGNLIDLEWLDLDQNEFTGKLPNVFSSLSKLEVLDVAGNHFEGQIPDTLWDTNPREVFLSVNGLVGNVPEEFCGKEVERITVDDSTWFEDKPKVSCSCCDEGKCFMWDLGRDVEHIQCPSTNIITFDYEKTYTIKDVIAEEQITQNIGTSDGNARMCLSPTGCYRFNVTITEGLDASFFAAYSTEKEKIVIKNITGVRDIETCDVVDVCGEIIGHDHKKRLGLNHITQLAAPTLSDLLLANSPTYKAICGAITKDEMYERYEVCDGTLLQRYVLLYFYYSHGLDFNSTELFRKETCTWPGVACDIEEKFITSLNLSGRELRGTLVTEIGLLKTLKVIDLSNNSFVGTIDPSVYTNLPNLEKVLLGMNKYAGTFPKDLIQFEKLKEFNIAGNLFVGHVPDSIEFSMNLEIFDISDNLFQGKFPIPLLKSSNLSLIDLSQNNFDDTIPTEIGDLKKLRSLLLHENSFDGSIPFEIFEARNIEKLMLQSNDITGSIPTQIAKLKGVTEIYMSHNKLKGFIPSELGDLMHLGSLQLHRNLLHGDAPVLKKKNLGDFGYITDCGDPDWRLPESLVCPGCTMCCNSMKNCQLADPTVLSNINLILIVVLIPIVFLFLFIFCLKRQRNFIIDVFLDDRDPLSIFNDDSVYCFILSNNLLGTLIYFVTVSIQIGIFGTYLSNSEFREDSDWEYSYKCLGNSIECEKDKTDDATGLLLFIVVTLLFLGNDFSMSVLQMRKAVYLWDKQLLLSGFILFFLTAFATLVSYRYNTALAEKNTDWITNAMILLFVNELDEKVLNILIALSPDWTEMVLDQVTENMETKRPHHVPSHLPAVGAARLNMKRPSSNGKAPMKAMPIPTKIPNAKNLHYPIPPAIVGLLRKPSSRFHLNEKNDPDSANWPTDKIENPSEKNWHQDEISMPESNESDANENDSAGHYEVHSDSEADLDAKRHKVTRIDFLDLNRDQTTDFDSSTETHEKSEADIERSNQDQSTRTDFLETKQTENIDSNHVTLNGEEIVVADYLDSKQDKPNEVTGLDLHQDHTLNVANLDLNQGGTNETVAVDIVQDPLNQIDYPDAIQVYRNEVVVLDVVQDPQNEIDHLETNQDESHTVSNHNRSDQGE